ncbi:TIR domain-containing protein [Endothiovibrio diazotrophicus]
MARVFISYSHRDEKWKERVVRQLGVLEEQGIELWEDRQIMAGDEWEQEITQALEWCNIALLLVSAHSLTSDYILRKEVTALLERRRRDGVRLIPLILSPCQWKQLPWLSLLQVRPTDGRPLSGMSEHDAEQALSELAGEIHKLTQRGQPTAATGPSLPLPPDAVEIHLPRGADHFFGREVELATLDDAWEAADGITVVELIAPGGVGKTSLVDRWLGTLRRDNWRGARRVYGWSFYSQGTGEDRQASEEHFLDQAVKWFGVEVAENADPWTKGQKLAEAVAAQRTLLILDGVEPLQYPPGPLAGELRAPGLKTLLEHLARAGQPGLCVVTSRERLEDLNPEVRDADCPHGAVAPIDLGELSEADGAKLLHALGANRAGAAPVEAGDGELKEAARAVRGHALTLSLLGRYLALAYGGDIRKRDQVDLHEADTETTDGHAFKVMAAYETWFVREGEKRARELAALRLLGFFDRPAHPAGLAVLRAEPAIAGLTEPLVGLSPAQWNTTLTRLRQCGLLLEGEGSGEAAGTLDAHPLVREYLARRLAKEQPAAWREGHRRLYEQLKGSAPHHPEGLAALQPLYQAVAHGCLAGLYEEARAEVYRDRVLRGTGSGGFYSTRQLGAFGADLGAVACLFEMPWRRPAPALSEAAQAWLLNEAATRLRALGRLEEALEPMEAGAERLAKQEAATSYGNLSELQLTLGRIDDAVGAAERSVELADRSGDAFQRMVNRTTLADALHQRGEFAEAAERFREAEAMQAEWQPGYPLLYSLQGFRYCDRLLTEAERAAWRGTGEAAPIRACEAVAERGAKMIEWRLPTDSMLDIALDHLTLARCALYTARLQGRPPEAAAEPTEEAVTGLRAAGDQDMLPHALLTRAHLRHALGDPAGAAADLAEARRIAARGNMRLHMADYHLHHARLFPDRPDARDHLRQARELIEACQYLRRLPELEDAERAAGLPRRSGS